MRETNRLEKLNAAAYYLGRNGRMPARFHELCEQHKASDQEIANAAICYYRGWLSLARTNVCLVLTKPDLLV